MAREYNRSEHPRYNSQIQSFKAVAFRWFPFIMKLSAKTLKAGDSTLLSDNPPMLKVASYSFERLSEMPLRRSHRYMHVSENVQRTINKWMAALLSMLKKDCSAFKAVNIACFTSGPDKKSEMSGEFLQQKMSGERCTICSLCEQQRYDLGPFQQRITIKKF